MSEAEYQEARRRLDDLCRQIDDAPAHAKPVFPGIVELHDAVHRYERAHKCAP